MLLVAGGSSPMHGGSGSSWNCSDVSSLVVAAAPRTAAMSIQWWLRRGTGSACVSRLVSYLQSLSFASLGWIICIFY